MPKRTNEFQRLVFLVKSHVATGATVSESKFLRDNVTGTEREVDICIESVIAGHAVTVSTECRDRGRTAGVQWVEEMKAKHERLPTNALVLISTSTFTKEALAVSRTYGIETTTLAALNDSVADRLFGDTSSLWSKHFTATPTKLIMRVSPSESLKAENVAVFPDSLVHNSEGHILGTAKDFVECILRTERSVRYFSEKGESDHKWFEIRVEPPLDKDGQSFYLEKSEPKLLRAIDSTYIAGSFDIEISEFPLKFGLLGNVKVAWGKGQFLGKEALLVASEDPTAGRKITISNETGFENNQSKRS